MKNNVLKSVPSVEKELKIHWILFSFFVGFSFPRLNVNGDNTKVDGTNCETI